MNKKIIFVGLVLAVGIVFLSFYFSKVSDEQEKDIITGGVANPSAIYCGKLGYEYNIIETTKGKQGFCTFPDGSECSGWAFYAGKCGQKWSYCEQNGYDIEIRSDGRDPYSPESYMVCVDKNTKEEIGPILELTNLGSLGNKISYIK